MRGRREPQVTMLAFVDLEERVPRNHPLRVVKQFADRALVDLSPVFDKMYAAGGRPSIPPERLLEASLLIALFSVRSDLAHLLWGQAWLGTWPRRMRQPIGDAHLLERHPTPGSPTPSPESDIF